MGQILVRNLEDSVIERLKARALKTDKSLEQSVRDILIEAAKPSKEEVWAEIDRLREFIGPVTLDATDLIRERLGQPLMFVADASVAVKWFVKQDRWEEARALAKPPQEVIAPELVLAEIASALWNMCA